MELVEEGEEGAEERDEEDLEREEMEDLDLKIVDFDWGNMTMNTSFSH